MSNWSRWGFEYVTACAEMLRTGVPSMTAWLAPKVNEVIRASNTFGERGGRFRIQRGPEDRLRDDEENVSFPYGTYDAPLKRVRAVFDETPMPTRSLLRHFNVVPPVFGVAPPRMQTQVRSAHIPGGRAHQCAGAGYDGGVRRAAAHAHVRRVLQQPVARRVLQRPRPSGGQGEGGLVMARTHSTHLVRGDVVVTGMVPSVVVATVASVFLTPCVPQSGGTVIPICASPDGSAFVTPHHPMRDDDDKGVGCPRAPTER